MEKQKQPFGKLSAACCASREWGAKLAKINNVLCAEPFARFEFGLCPEL